MYAVIKTGGKQYRVQPGDVLVVEKLDGDVGSTVKFDQILAHGEGGDVTLGAPLVDGAFVHATLIETRKGEKVKIFKKIRRQGYRRTRGHRQHETVLRVTGLEIGGETTKWDGEVDLSSKALINAKARGLTQLVAELEAAAAPAVTAEAPVAPKKAKAAPKTEAIDTAGTEADGVTAETAAPKKKAAPKAKPASDSAE
jgi:large subunit ribosomal protein L21